MSDYRAYPALNTALGTLYKFLPQCRSEGVKSTRRDYISNGGLYDQGLYVEMAWQLLPLSLYTPLLAKFGLDANNTYHDVTVYCRDDTYVYHLYNGRAIRPLPSWQNSFVRNFTILVRDLVRID